MSKIPVFDVGDTLFPTVKFYKNAVRSECATEDSHIGNFNIFKPREIEAYFDGKGVDVNGENIRENYKRNVKEFMQRSGRIDTLKKCSEKFGEIGVISDNWSRAGRMYKKMFEENGIDYNGIIISEDIGSRKPEKAIFQAFLRKRRQPARKFVYFGNHGDRDPGAKKVGMNFVFTTEFHNFGTEYDGRKIDALSLDNIGREVQS